MKTMDTSLTPEAILHDIDQFGRVVLIFKSVQVLDFRKAGAGVLKNVALWPFQISKVKRIQLHRISKNVVEIKGEPHYNTDMNNFQNVFLKNRTAAHITPLGVTEGVPVSPEKKKDIANLLIKHFGTEWRSNAALNFYKLIIDGNSQEDSVENVDEPDCCYVPEIAELIV